jgi:hypothetical protein
MFLTDQELKKITGFKYSKYQSQWLSKHGLPFTFNGKGELNVLVSDYVKKFGLKDARIKSKEQEPEFEAIRDINGKKAKKTPAFTAESNL